MPAYWIFTCYWFESLLSLSRWMMKWKLSGIQLWYPTRSLCWLHFFWFPFLGFPRIRLSRAGSILNPPISPQYWPPRRPVAYDDPPDVPCCTPHRDSPGVPSMDPTGAFPSMSGCPELAIGNGELQQGISWGWCQRRFSQGKSRDFQSS